MKHSKTILVLALFLPFTAFAAVNNIEQFLNGTLTDIINVTIKFLVAVATLIFIGSVVYYISLGGDSEKLSEAKRFIIFAVLGLVLIFTVWGFVNLIIDSLNLNENAPRPPQIIN